MFSSRGPVAQSKQSCHSGADEDKSHLTVKAEYASRAPRAPQAVSLSVPLLDSTFLVCKMGEQSICCAGSSYSRIRLVSATGGF